MKAAVYEEFGGAITIQEVPSPIPESHGVVLKVLATGLCLSDWHGWMGHDPDIVLPHVPGHELVGTIVAAGKNVKNFQEGDRVTIPFVGACGRCEQCQSGNHQVCDDQSQPGFTHWGSFAEYVKLDQADINLVKVPDDMSNETAAILGCRFVTSYRAIVEQGRIKGGEYIAVHGCGGVGLSAIMIAQALGAQVIAVDINNETLKLARELGATATVNANELEDVVQTVRDISKGGVHVSIDALGSQITCYNSIANLRKRGRHVQVGLMTGKDQHPNIPMDQVIAHELEIYGSHGMQAYKYPEMLSMIYSGKLDPQSMIEKTVSLEKSIHLLPKMNEYTTKGIIVINSF